MKKAAFFLFGCFLISCSDEEKSPSILTITPNGADFEQTVTIAGSNFSTSLLENEVSFNGTPATVTSATATELVVTVPVNSTSGKISIKSQGRQVISATDFTVSCGSWATAKDAPEYGENTETSIFTTQGKGFVLFGQPTVDGVIGDASLYVYDPSANNWTPKTIYDKTFQPILHASWGSASGKGFVLEPMGGDLHVYDVATDSWSVKDNPYDATNSDKYPVLAFSIGDDGYILLSDNNVWKYNIAGDSWEKQGIFPGEINYAFEANGLATGTKGYIANGANLWEYNPTTKQWAQRASRTTDAFLVFATNDHIYAGDYSTEMKGVWEFNADSNTWIRKASLKGNPRYSALAFGIGSQGYVGMGAQTANDWLVKDFYAYTPSGIIID